jgi:YfiH family protein
VSPLPLWPLGWVPPAGVAAACTTREGGVSLAPYDALNLGDHVGDDPERVAQNRARLAATLGVRPVFLQQVHGTAVLHLTADTPDGLTADASWTATPALACTILVADCLPVLLADRQGRAVGAAHAGWRGLAQGVLPATVEAMCAGAGLAPDDVCAWLGPCIGPTAFEVGAEVRAAFVEKNSAWAAHFQPLAQAEKYRADLPALAAAQLRQLGVRTIAGNAGEPEWCTVSQPSVWFSFRRSRGATGRFAAGIWRSL